MREKLRRYGKQVMVYICTFVIVAGSVFSFSFESKASSFSVNYSEPAVSDNQGYLLIELQDSSGNRMINTFFWTINQQSSSGSMNSGVSLVIRPNSVAFNVGESGDYSIGEWLLGAYWNSGSFSVVNTRQYTEHFTHTYSYSGQTIVGFSWKGNVVGLTNYVSNNQTPTMTFSQQEASVKLQSIIGSLSTMIMDNDSIIARLTSIMNNTDTLEQKLQSLIDLQNQVLSEHKESNTWLEKIWNSIQEFLGKEPEEDAAPPVDEDNMLGSMEETEDALFPDTSEAEQSLNVQLNSGFSVLTWLVESFAKMDAGVFSMFLTMLTFGVMALLLGR